MFTKEIKEKNQVGLHARPATFFIQKANEYKSTINIERDEKKALKLIKKAAEGDLPQAYEKLAIMYRNGDGAKQDLVESIKWLEKLFDNYKECFEKEPSIKKARIIKEYCNKHKIKLSNALIIDDNKKTLQACEKIGIQTKYPQQVICDYEAIL